VFQKILFFLGNFAYLSLTLNFLVTPDLLEIYWSRFWVGQQLHVKEKDKQETRVVNAGQQHIHPLHPNTMMSKINT